LAAQAVHDNHELIRDQVRAESPWWVPGVVDEKIYERIVGAIERLLRQIATHPGHPLRATFDAALRDLIDRLEHSPEAIARTEAMKEDWLAEPGILSIAAGAAYLALVPDPGPVQKRSSSIGLNLDRRTMARIFVILLVATSCGGVIF